MSLIDDDVDEIGEALVRDETQVDEVDEVDEVDLDEELAVQKTTTSLEIDVYDSDIVDDVDVLGLIMVMPDDEDDELDESDDVPVMRLSEVIDEYE